MIKITLQRNDSKTKTDKIWHNQDTIVLNNQRFEFPKGKNIYFESPNDQILDAYRDAKGSLYAIIVKQYVKEDRYLYEGQDQDAIVLTDDLKEDSEYNIVKVKINPDSEYQYISDEMLKTYIELQEIRTQILTAQADEDEKLLVELRKRRDEIKSKLTSFEKKHN